MKLIKNFSDEPSNLLYVAFATINVKGGGVLWVVSVVPDG
jgi:hypothetical protein